MPAAAAVAPPVAPVAGRAAALWSLVGQPPAHQARANGCEVLSSDMVSSWGTSERRRDEAVPCGLVPAVSLTTLPKKGTLSTSRDVLLC